MDFEIFDGQLGVVFKDGSDLPGNRIKFNLAGELDKDPALEVFDHQIESQKRVKGVLEGLGEVDETVQELENREAHFNRGDL